MKSFEINSYRHKYSFNYFNTIKEIIDEIKEEQNIALSIIFGAILGPAFYFISPEWCILLGGFISGTIAFFIGEKK